MANKPDGSRAPVHVTVTGAAGQIGYSLVFRIASGQLRVDHDAGLGIACGQQGQCLVDHAG